MQRIARILLGLVFVVFSANYFHKFIPDQAPPPAEAMTFAMALVGSGLMTFLKVIEMIAGLALIANAFTPLALAVLAPIVVGIGFFHIVLAPAGLPVALAVLALELYLAWSYRKSYAPMLRFRAEEAPRETVRELVTSSAR